MGVRPPPPTLVELGGNVVQRWANLNNDVDRRSTFTIEVLPSSFNFDTYGTREQRKLTHQLPKSNSLKQIIVRENEH